MNMFKSFALIALVAATGVAAAANPPAQTPAAGNHAARHTSGRAQIAACQESAKSLAGPAKEKAIQTCMQQPAQPARNLPPVVSHVGVPSGN